MVTGDFRAQYFGGAVWTNILRPGGVVASGDTFWIATSPRQTHDARSRAPPAQVRRQGLKPCDGMVGAAGFEPTSTHWNRYKRF